MRTTFHHFLLFCLFWIGVVLPSSGQKKQKLRLPPPETYTAISPDSRYVAIDYSAKRFEGGQYVFKNILKVYHLKSRRYIARIDFLVLEDIQGLAFSPDGTKLFARTGKDILLFDVRTRAIQKRFERAAALGFTSGDATGLVAEKGEVQQYDLSNNRLIFKYGGVYNYSIKSLGESPDQRWIYAETADGKFIFWQKGNPKPHTILEAKEIRFLPTEEKLVTLGYRNRLGYISVYNTGELTKIKEFNSNDYLHYSTYTFNSGSSLSPDGKTAIFCAKRYEETIGLGFFDVLSGKQLFELDTLSVGEQFYLAEQPYHWFGNTEILVKLRRKGAISFSLQDSSSFEVAFDSRLRNYRISPDGKGIISFQKDKWIKSSVMAVQTTFLPDEQKTEFLDNQEYLAFSPDGKYLFISHVKDKTNAFVILHDWYQGKPLKVYEFAKKPYKTGDEEVIETDAEPPPGYNHLYLQHLKPLEQITDTTELSLVYRSVKVTPDSVEWQFHLLDNAGNYYAGLEDEKYRSWICELSLTDSTGKQRPLTNYSLLEKSYRKETPLSLSIVMDHSGSMGDSRTIIVQEAAEDFIEQMQEEDTLALLKYDHRVKVESAFAHRKTLLSRLEKNGLGQLGGSTALFDAAHQAVRMLASLPPEIERNVILFTDGFENSSIITQNELIRDARKYMVHLHTIGFGESIDEEMLKTISQSTGGGYYRIYKTPDFLRIFNDVYKKMRHYYSIHFPKEQSGQLSLKLKICPPGKTPIESKTSFFTHPRFEDEKPVEEIAESGFTGFDVPPSEGDVKLLKVQFAFGSANMVGAFQEEIDKAVAYLKKYDHVKVELRGHTDSIGSHAYNQQLSEARAKALLQKLAEAGISANRLSAKGYGENLPIATNETEAGRQQNRRTELFILGAGESN